MRILSVLIIMLFLLITSCVPPPANSKAHISQAATPSAEKSQTLSPSPLPTLTPTSTYLAITPAFSGTPVPLSSSVISVDNIHRLTLLARWGNGNAGRIQYTPDGKFLVAGSTTGIYFYEPENFSLVRYIDTQDAVLDMAIVAGGQKIATSSFDQISVYNIDDGSMAFSINVSADNIAVSPDGKVLATDTEGSSSQIQFWSMEDGSPIKAFDESDGLSETILFSPDGRFLATGGNAVRIWKLDGSLADSHGPYVSGGGTYSLSFSPDGSLLAEGADSDAVHLWRVLDDGKLSLARKFSVPKYPSASAIAISPDGKKLAAGTTAGLYIWQIKTGILQHKMDTDFTMYSSVVWSLDSKYLISSSDLRGMEVWDVDNGSLLHQLNPLSGNLSALAWSPTGKMLAVGNDEGTVYLLQAKDGAVTNIGNGYVVNSLAFSLDGQDLAAGFDNGSIRIWGIDKSLVKAFDGFGGIARVLFLPDGEVFAAHYNDWDDYTLDSVQLWKTNDWEKYKDIGVGKWQDVTVVDFALSSDHQKVMIAVRDMTGHNGSYIEVFNVADGTSLNTLDFEGFQHSIFLEALSLSPDGKTLAALSTEGDFVAGEVEEKVRLWRVSDWEWLNTISIIPTNKNKGISYSLENSIGWTPDGTLFALGVPDGTVQIRRARDGELLQTLTGHSMWVTSVAFSKDGRILATASIDGTIRLWGIK